MPNIEQILAPDGISYDWNSPEWIIIHYTATNASAYNNAVYFSRGGSWSSSAHYFVDGGGTIYQSVPDHRGAWHAGNYECNTHSIGIETVSDGYDFTDSEISELAWLVGKLMEEYGIPAERVIRHFDVADCFGGYTLDPHKWCPAPYVDWDKWQELKAVITNGGDDVSAEQVWNYGIAGPNVTLSAAQRLVDIETYIHDDEDPTGRGKKADMKTRIAFMAEKQEKMQASIDELDAKLDAILEAVADAPVKGDE